MHSSIPLQPRWFPVLHIASNGRKSSHAVKDFQSPKIFSLTPWSWVLPDGPVVHEVVEKSVVFYGTRRFITAFTRARHQSLSWAKQIRSRAPIFNSIFPSTLSSKWSLLLRLLYQNPVHTSPTYMSRAPSISSCCGQQYRSRSSSLCSLLQFPVTSSILGSRIFFRTVFSKILFSLCSSFSVLETKFHTRVKESAKLSVYLY